MGSHSRSAFPDRPPRSVSRRTLLLAATAAIGTTAGASAIAGYVSDSRATNAPDWVTPPVNPAAGSGADVTGGVEVTHGPRDKPAVALTFHGEGDPGQVHTLLDELERGGARVTVLAVGSWLAAQPAMARRILDAGHELGNHTQNHLTMSELDTAGVFAEINGCAETLKRLTGSAGRWFRPSSAQHATDTVRAQAALVGYPACLSYDVDSLDYTDPDPAAVVRAITDPISNGSIVSMHFGHAATVAAIPEILDRLRQRGLRPVTMTELMA
jgi:peptidoglycan/xylan/chitin deacetylase (PgdA/CDA1 family)